MRRKSIGLMLAAFAILVGSVVNADDEKIAKHLYNKLSEAKQQGSLKNFTLDLEVKDGVVFFSGRVTDKTQKVMVFVTALLSLLSRLRPNQLLLNQLLLNQLQLNQLQLNQLQPSKWRPNLLIMNLPVKPRPE